MIFRMSHSSPVSIIHCVGQDGLLILGQGWFCGHLLKKIIWPQNAKLWNPLSLWGSERTANLTKVSWVTLELCPLWCVSNKIYSSDNKIKLFLISYGAISACGQCRLDVSFRSSLSHRVCQVKEVCHNQDLKMGQHWSPCLPHRRTKPWDTLPGLEVRLCAPNCGICTQSAALLPKNLCSSFLDKPCLADPSRVWENIYDLYPSLNTLV